MNTIQSYLEKFGGNFLVAAFIPSVAFVTASVLLFGPVVPVRVLTKLQFLLSPFSETNLAWLIFLLAVIVGFTLTSLNEFIYKIFEGYVFTKRLSSLRQIELKRAYQYRQRRDMLNKKIHHLQKRLAMWKKDKMPVRTKEAEKKITDSIQFLEAERDDISAEYDQRYPPHEKLILPTRFGNILRASETYSLDRWGIDAVTMWPRLIYAVSTAPKGDQYLAKVDISNDQCSFLLNSSLLSAIFAIIALIISTYQGFMFYLSSIGATEVLYFVPIDAAPRIYLQRILIYFIIAIGGIGLFWFFYNASLYNVSQYGNLIRSTYDLFHLRLLKTLRMDDLPITQLPTTSDEERQIWEVVCEYIAMGNINAPSSNRRPIYFEYDTSDEYKL